MPSASGVSASVAPVPSNADAFAPTITTHEIKMVGDDRGYRFEPANLTIKSGDAVKFVAISGFPHNVAFVGTTLAPAVKSQLDANFGADRLAELMSQMYLSPNEGFTLSFANIPAGRYEFFCMPHQMMGELGVIEVVEGGNPLSDGDFHGSETVGSGDSYPNADYGIVDGAPPIVGYAEMSRALIERFNYDVTRRFDYSSRVLESGIPYLIRIGGRGGVGPLDARNYQNSMPDAAFRFCGEFQNLDKCQVPITGNSWWPNNWDGVGNRRPSPDQYRLDHVYDFYVQGRGRSLRWSFEDNPYSDNRGDFWVEIYRLESLDSGSEDTGSGLVGGTEPVNVDQPYFDFQVEKPAASARGSPGPRYPDILRSGGVEGEVLAQFVVDTLGLVEVLSFRVLRSSHALFEQAVRSSLPNLRFLPAEVGGRRVKQLVQQPFVFNLPR